MEQQDGEAAGSRNRVEDDPSIQVVLGLEEQELRIFMNISKRIIVCLW